ncbi:MAG TPA: hypothetical protein VGG08_01650 [Solirubrobacteraceae bacterium]|jgi:hypothetical protein
MPRLAIAALLIAALAVSTSGCGTKTVSVTGPGGVVTTRTVPNIHFAKTKFALHMGLAFGSFHRYVYKPFRAGVFTTNAPGRLRAFLKAGTAAIFAVHELRTAREDALSDSHLGPLVERIEGLLGSLAHIGASFKRGTLKPAVIASAASTVAALGSSSSSLGVAIKEVAPAF